MGKKVWIGEFVSILRCETIGGGELDIMSVVNKDIQAHNIMVGCPTQIIKKYDFSKKECQSVKS